MKKIKQYAVFVGLILIPLIAACFLFGNSEREQQLEERRFCRSLYAQIESGNKTEQIIPWRDESGIYYLIVPSYALDTGAVTFQEDNRYGLQVWLDGMRAGMDNGRDDGVSEKTYTIEFRENSGKIKERSQLKVLCSGKLPSVFVTTSSGSMDTIHASKDNKEKGLVSIYTEQGGCDYAGQLNHIKGRGNATWQQSKKPYNLSLQQEESLLGMKTASEWALLAGAMDRSYIRNKMAFDMAQEIGLAGTPDAAFVELYLNGEYAGLYLLAQKVEPAEDPAAGEEYLLEIEMQERLAGEVYGFQTEAGQAIVIKGKNNLAQNEITELQKQIQRVEDAIGQERWDRVWELMDQESYTGIYLMEEILQNHDAYISSQYMSIYKKNGSFGKFYSGPVWDFDTSLSPKDGMYASTLTAGQPRKGYPKFWVTDIVKNREFQEKAAAEYQKIRTQYLESGIWDNMELCRSRIADAVELDCLRWKQQSAGEWKEAIQELKGYLQERLEFLDEFWSGQEIFHTVRLKMESDIFSGMDYYIKDGQTCVDFPRELKKEGYTFTGWYLEGTDTAFTTETPVYADLSIEARWKPAGDGGLLDQIRSLGLLQMRYLLFGGIFLATCILFIIDRNRFREFRK